MAEKKSDSSGTLSKAERDAVKERAAELKAQARNAKSANKAAADAKAVDEAIAKLAPADRAIAEKVHALIAAATPQLAPRTWYGMPAYARDGKVVTFFQGADKFETRYHTLGFSDPAQLDDGTIWPTSYAITTIGPAEEKTITALLKKAVGG